MPNKWTTPTQISTGISGVSVSAGANYLGSEISNDSDLNQFARVDLQFTCSSAPTDNSPIELYAIYAVDSSGYEDGDNSIDPVKAPLHVFVADARTSAQRLSAFVPIDPFKFKFLIKSELNQTASPLTLKAFAFNDNPSA